MIFGRVAIPTALREMKCIAVVVMLFTLAMGSSVSAAAIQPGTTILGVSWSGFSYHVDVATGIDTVLSNPNRSFNAMARSSSGNFYASDNSNRVYSIDPIDGTAQLQATIAGFGNSESIRGLAYSNDGRLYAVANTPFGDIARFFEIDLSFGNASFVGSTGMRGLQSLAVAEDGTFYSFQISGDGLEDLGLVTIAPSTGVATDINPLDSELGSGMQSLAFGHDGVLYGMGQGGEGQGVIFTIDTTDGHLSQLTSVSVGLRGMEFLPIPEPRGLTLLLIASIGFFSARAKQCLRLFP